MPEDVKSDSTTEEVEDRRTEAPEQNLFNEVSTADSYMYDKYQLRPYNPDIIFQKKGNYDLFDEMREDDQVNALLTLKKLMTISEWEISCEDEKVKEFVKWSLEEAMDELFEKKLFNILSAFDYGYSLTEKIVKYIDTPFGKKYVFTSLKTRAPHSYLFNTDEYGNIKDVLQYTEKGSDVSKPNSFGAGLTIPYSKFVHFANRKEFDNPYGISECNLGVYRAWWSKDNIIKFWNISLEKYGMPTVVGKYGKGSGKDKSQFLKVLKNIQASTSITMPEGFAVDLLQAKNVQGGGGFEAAIDKYNQMISRKMLVPDLMGISGASTGGGSYSLGREQFGMFYEIVSTDKKQLERMITRDLVQQLVNWNFGKNIKAEFKFIPINESKKQEQMKIWLEAVKTGKVEPSPDQLNHFLQAIEFPEFDEAYFKQQELEKKEKEAKEENMANQKMDMIREQNKMNAKVEPIKKEKVKEKVIEKPIKKKFKDYYRELTQWEKRYNFQDIDDETDKLHEKYIGILSDNYELAINRLVNDIKRKKIIEKKRLDLVNDLTLKPMTKPITDMLKESRKLGTVTAKFEVTQGLKKFVVETSNELSNDEVAEWLNNYSFYVNTQEAGFILGKVKPILMESIRNGNSVKETITMIETALAGYDATLGANRIETMVRTTTSKAFNEARAQEYEKAKDEIIGYQYSAIMDGRTSAICTALDELIFKPNELSTYNPPNHFNCRSVVFPIFKGEDFEYSTLPAIEKEGGDFLKLKKGES